MADIEALVRALGGSVAKRGVSRVKIELFAEQWRCHRLHPGNAAKRYQVEEARELLIRAGRRESLNQWATEVLREAVQAG